MATVGSAMKKNLPYIKITPNLPHFAVSCGGARVRGAEARSIVSNLAHLFKKIERGFGRDHIERHTACSYGTFSLSSATFSYIHGQYSGNIAFTKQGLLHCVIIKPRMDVIYPNEAQSAFPVLPIEGWDCKLF
jgi:hypothetical protein